MMRYMMNLIKIFEFKNRILDLVGIMYEYLFIDVGVLKIDAEFGKNFEEKSKILAKKERSNC
jgi:hypothetical protein